jgi:hypothetical protein
MLERGSLAAFALALAACSFNGGGVSDDTGDDADASVDASEETDQDADGVVDAADNCPMLANAEQEDEDADAVGNVCDNCPHVANVDQANNGETGAGAERDGAGDICDPDPTAPGNDILYFEGFDDADVRDDWRTQGGGTWNVSAGAMRQTSTNGFHTLYSVADTFDGAIVATRVIVDDMPPSTGTPDTNRGVASVVAFAPGSGNGNGYLCLLYTNPRIAASGNLTLATMMGSQPSETEAYVPLGTDLQEEASYDIETGVDGPSGALRCSAESAALSTPFALAAVDTTYSGGFVGLRTQNTAAHYEYVVVFGDPK